MTDVGTVGGLLLAGGISRRMGAPDKMLRDVGGASLLSRVIARIAPQAGPLLLNANGDPARFAAYGLPVAADIVPGHAGPLAGILTGMDWLRRHHPGVDWMVSCPTDTPMIPADLVDRLMAAVWSQGADMACAMSGGMVHPVVGVWPVRLAGDLAHAVRDRDIRKIDLWTSGYRMARVEWPGGSRDPFFNINTREDLVRFSMIERGCLPDPPPERDRITLGVEMIGGQPSGLFLPNRDDAASGGDDRHCVIHLTLTARALPLYRRALSGSAPQLHVLVQGGRVIRADFDPADLGAAGGDGCVVPLPLTGAVMDRIVRFTAGHPADPRFRKGGGSF